MNQAHTARRLARVAGRRLQSRLSTTLTPETWWNSTLGPVPLVGGICVLRPPQVSDGPEWVAQRLRNRRRLEIAFPADTDDWADGQTELAWAERCLALRAAARHGRAFPFVILLDGVLVGEYGIDAVDVETGTGEQSGWIAKTVKGGTVAAVADALGVLHAFTGPRPLQRVVGPNATDSPAAGILLNTLGYQREIVLSQLRDTGAGVKDHEVWVIHNTQQSRDFLRQRLAGLAVR